MSHTAVGFIGLGQIGKPMALRLTDWPGGLWVYDIDADAVAALEQAGAKRADSVGEVAAHATLISVMVRDDAQVRAVVDDILVTAPPGTVVCVHSTIHPDTARELATVADTRGVHLLDAPVSGGAIGANSGRLALMVGGDADAFAAAQEYLDRMGDLVVHLGPAGAGTAAKLARNLVHFVAFAAAGEALRLCEAAQLDLPTFGKIVRHTDAVTGGPGAIMLRDTARPVTPDDPWAPILQHVCALGEKDLTFAIELGDSLGVDTPLAALALARLGANLGLDGTKP